jgi:hypothetical protein
MLLLLYWIYFSFLQSGTYDMMYPLAGVGHDDQWSLVNWGLTAAQALECTSTEISRALSCE